MATPNRIELLNAQYQTLGTTLTIAAENGLFQGRSAPARAKIEAGIAAMEAALAANNVGKAEEELYRLQVDYYAAVTDRGLWWRLVSIYGATQLAASFLGAYAAVELASRFFAWNGTPDLRVLLAGIAGASLKGLYFTIQKSAREALRRVWIVSSLIGPFVGLLLAIFVHYSFAGGLAVLSTKSETSALNQDAIIWVALFAGLRWEWAIGLFDKLSSKFQQ